MTVTHLLPNALMHGQDTGSKAFNCVNSSIGLDSAGVPDRSIALMLFLRRITNPFVLAALAFLR
jgi:hypothetical protein